jgi:glycosyltransferase involved in cell wall biosynthesis
MLQIILSTYNGSQYIVDQLESIISQQTQYEYEILIRDDGSTDDTCLLIKETFERFGFSNFQFEKGENIGYMKSFLSLIKKATSEFILFSDQDDIWHPEKIEYFMNEFRRLSTREKYIVLYSEVNVFGEVEIPNYYKSIGLNPTQNLEKHFFDTFISACSMGVNDKVKNLYLKHAELMNGVVSHDTVNLMIGCLTNSLFFIDIPLFNYRIHGKNTVGISINKESPKTKIKNLLKYVFNNRAYRVIKFNPYYATLAIKLKELDKYEPFILKGNHKYLDLAINFDSMGFWKRKWVLAKYHILPESNYLDKAIRLLCI